MNAKDRRKHLRKLKSEFPLGTRVLLTHYHVRHEGRVVNNGPIIYPHSILVEITKEGDREGPEVITKHRWIPVARLKKLTE